ncbi:MAG: DUF2461 family protein [Acidimicrobiales bacterium]
MTEFTGFPKTGLDFLTTLGTKNKMWFDDNRTVYDADVVAPAKAFVSAMGDALGDRISTGIEAQPKTNGSIAPINNDVRFNPDASPYKDHLMFRFWEGANKKTAPMLMVRLHPEDGVGFASGMMIGDLDRWRTAIDEDGEPFAADLADLVQATKAEVVGEGLKRVPKPYAEDHPRGDLLRHKGFQVRWQEKVPKSVSTSSFADWCAMRLEKTADIHHWLVAHFA